MPTTYSCEGCNQTLEPSNEGSPGLCRHCGSQNIAAHVFAGDDLVVGISEVSGIGLVIPDVGLHIPAVVELGTKNVDGHAIEAIAPAWFEIVRLICNDRNALYGIGWRQLEELIAGAYARDGYSVTLTPRSGDRGRDIIAEKRGYSLIRIVDSVKAYGAGRRVSADEVRALWGVVALDKATKGVLSTTASFAPGISKDPFIAEQIPHRLELIDGATLVERLRTLIQK